MDLLFKFDSARVVFSGVVCFDLLYVFDCAEVVGLSLVVTSSGTLFGCVFVVRIFGGESCFLGGLSSWCVSLPSSLSSRGVATGGCVCALLLECVGASSGTSLFVVIVDENTSVVLGIFLLLYFLAGFSGSLW